MKKIIIPLIIATMLLALTPTMTVKAATSDTFTITVSGEYLYIEIQPDTWDIGVVAMGSSTYSNATPSNPYFTADTSNSTVDNNLQLQITSDATDWNAATAGNGPGPDIYRLNASSDNWATENQIVVASATTIASITAGNDASFDLRFDAPISTSTGAQQTITITATVVKQ